LATVGNQTFVATETAYAPIVETLTNAAGCDSTITYNVTVSARTYADTVKASFCEGTEYAWDNTAEGGHLLSYKEAGIYSDTAFTASCATKIFTLDLKAKEKYKMTRMWRYWI